MPAAWVDFKAVRSQVRFAEVLDHYGVELKIKGEQLTGFCPLPGHAGSKKKSPSFSVNAKKNIFQCFGCGAKGNVLDFTALMEGLDPSDTSHLRKAALLLQERFLGEGTAPEENTPSAVETQGAAQPPALRSQAVTLEDDAEDEPSADGQPVVVNAPLDFSLTRLDPGHPYLKGRGLTPETIATFGLGYCSRGLMKGRIAIPLHDSEGQLIGYAGRLVDDQAVTPDTSKYLLPSSRERDGTVYKFKKGLFLFNAFRLEKPVMNLVVVEGFFGAMWLHQHGYPAVALMGSTCSATQAELLLSLVPPDGRVWLLPDGDEPGKRLAHQLFEQVAPSRFIRWLYLEPGQQPDDCSPERLAEWLARP